ncbi:MAG: hypothetical protein RIF46_02870 [Cyclobacteriaceae bacterium]
MKFNELKILLLLLMIPGFILFYNIMIWSDDKLKSRHEEIFFEDELFGVVVNSKSERGGIYLELADQRNVSFMSCYDFKTDRISLSYFLLEGDSLVKKKNSRSIYVKRSEEEFHFWNENWKKKQ